MFTQIIDYVGNGTVLSYDLKFDGAAVIIVPDAAAYIGFHMPTMWCARSNAIGAIDSIASGARIIGRKLLIGADASVNTNGVRYKAVILGADGGDIETPSWCGNATAGRTVKLARAATPVFCMVKRDSTRPPVAKITGQVTSALDGTAVNDSIALGSGVLTLTADPEVNEWNASSELGEGIDALIAHGSSGVKTGTYAGTGAAQNVGIGCDAALVIAWRPGSTETAKIYARGDFGGNGKAADASAPVSAGRLLPGILSLSGAVSNNSGGTYCYAAFPMREPRISRPLTPAAIIRGKRALSLPGRGTLGYVDFGTGLNINGQITLEWLGSVPGDAQSGGSFDGWLIGKAATGQSQTAGTASWGMSVVSRIDGGHGWQGPHMTSIVNGRVYYSSPLDAASWRTGIIVPSGVHMHQVVHRGSGEWEYWMDGRLVKQRKLSTDGVSSSSSHRVTMGARWTGSAYSNASRMLVLGARVYQAALTDSELMARHARARLGSLDADVTHDIAAAWEGASLSIGGASWTDSAGQNTGTITGGSVIDL